jgi:hypothetical protein
MSCPICQQRQVAMLENMLAIDAILFPGTTPSKKLSESEYKHYSKVKHATLLNLYEIYKNLDYVSENNFEGDVELMESFSYKLGETVLQNTLKMVKEDDNILSSINESAANSSVEVSSQLVIETVLSIALDNLMLEEAFNSGNIEQLDTTEGELLLNAYKSFRNDLLTFAVK